MYMEVLCNKLTVLNVYTIISHGILQDLKDADILVLKVLNSLRLLFTNLLESLARHFKKRGKNEGYRTNDKNA